MKNNLIENVKCLPTGVSTKVGQTRRHLSKIDVERIMKNLEFHTKEFPRSALQTVIENREDFIPELLKVLKYANKNIKSVAKDEAYFAHMYAVFLLAQFREKRAYPLIYKLLSHRGEIVSELFGDLLTEDMDRIFASVSCGNIKLIKKLIENKKLDEYVRGVGIRALTVLAVCGVNSREEIIDYFRSLFRKRLEREYSHVWDALAACSCDIHPGELYEDIKRAYDEDMICPEYVGFDEIQETVQKSRDEVINALKNNVRYKLIEDTISCMEGWCGFNPPKRHNKNNNENNPSKIIDESYANDQKDEQEAEKSDVMEKQKKIGRNEPCFCGSGKKYKKCCGKL